MLWQVGTRRADVTRLKRQKSLQPNFNAAYLTACAESSRWVIPWLALMVTWYGTHNAGDGRIESYEGLDLRQRTH